MIIYYSLYVKLKIVPKSYTETAIEKKKKKKKGERKISKFLDRFHIINYPKTHFYLYSRILLGC